ncbi:hypothetical protein D3C80_2026460 [compost metagenome]
MELMVVVPGTAITSPYQDTPQRKVQLVRLMIVRELACAVTNAPQETNAAIKNFFIK